MPNFQSLRVQIKVLAVAIFIVFIIALSGCSGNYSMGHSTKLYCGAVDYEQVPVKKAVTTEKADKDGTEVLTITTPVEQ